MLVMNQPPVLDFMVNKSANQYFAYLGFEPKSGFNLATVVRPEPVLSANQQVLDVTSKYSNISVFDVYEKYSEDGKVRVTHLEDILYFDDDHLTYEGTLICKFDLLLLIKSVIKSD
ncbi:SGNH hydrolase domain-containing protein [Flagellimonas marinaquae]